MSKTTSQADETPCRIRQRDTGGVREITEAQWKKDGKALRAEGFVRVDDNDQPTADESATDA